MEETSGRASPRGVVRRETASEGNNVAEVDIPCIGQTESERNLEGEESKKKCLELSRVKGKNNKKLSVLIPPWKARSAELHRRNL